ncbi:DegT/DnrJ/EryC1/StrS family aminotransferase, partial [Candidatus Woesearchaeota archaeon]|nr:DegT/DnrJ/EryC1/StrS family aminotransferase [Candidatus Woesearchaeota archaeon]
MNPDQYSKEIENWLCKLTGKKYCLLTGRGATAIYLVLKALGLPNDAEVVMPSFLCPSPAVVTILAGLKPVFCDIELADCNMSVNTVKRVLTPNSRVIIAPHIFGSPIEIDTLMEWANSKKLFVIEDCAQSIGGFYNGRPMGCFGHVAIFSFGETKVANAGYGGAILTNDRELYQRLLKEEHSLPESKNFKALSKGFYKIVSNALMQNQAIAQTTIKRYQGLFLFRYEPKYSKEILQTLTMLPETLRARARATKLLIKHLESESMRFVGAKGREVYHRACFMIDSS